MSILERLPSADKVVVSGAVPPSRPEETVTYQQISAEQEVKLASILSKVEKGGKAFVQKAVEKKGMPQPLKEKLKDILSIYESLTEQLSRSSKTNQIGRIVI